MLHFADDSAALARLHGQGHDHRLRLMKTSLLINVDVEETRRHSIWSVKFNLLSI